MTQAGNDLSLSNLAASIDFDLDTESRVAFTAGDANSHLVARAASLIPSMSPAMATCSNAMPCERELRICLRILAESLAVTFFESIRRSIACPIRIDPAEVPTIATLSRRSSMSSTFISPAESVE